MRIWKCFALLRPEALDPELWSAGEVVEFSV